MPREISFSSLVLTVLIGSILVVGGGLLVLSYLGATRVLDEELKQQALKTEEIGSLLIESWLATGAHSAEDLSKDRSLVAAVAEGREALARDLLTRAFLTESRAGFDFLYIETQPGRIWIERMLVSGIALLLEPATRRASRPCLRWLAGGIRRNPVPPESAQLESSG